MTESIALGLGEKRRTEDRGGPEIRKTRRKLWEEEEKEMRIKSKIYYIILPMIFCIFNVYLFIRTGLVYATH